MNEEEPQPQVAFFAAALVLLVMPLVVLFGLSALGLAAGLLAPVDRAMSGEAWALLLGLFILWIVLVVGVVLFICARLSRRRIVS